MKKECNILISIMDSAEDHLTSLCKCWTLQDKQRYFVNFIGIYDKLFINASGQDASRYFKPFYERIVRFSYPVFISRFYDSNFETLSVTAICPLDKESMVLLNNLIYTCGIIGWMKYLIDNINAGYLSYIAFFNHVRIKFIDRYHWIEYLEQMDSVQ